MSSVKMSAIPLTGVYLKNINLGVMEMDQNSLERIRNIARSLARRVQDDPNFADQVRDDPYAVLKTAGLPDEFVAEFLEQTQLSEIQGYSSPSCGLTVIL